MDKISAFAAYKKPGINLTLKNQTNKKKNNLRKQNSKNTSEKLNGKNPETATGKEEHQKRGKKRKQKAQSPDSLKKLKELASIDNDRISEDQENKQNSKEVENAAEVKEKKAIVKTEQSAPTCFVPLRNDSIKEATKLFRWLISPVRDDDFFQKFWEKAPCLIERKNAKYFSKLISFEKIDKMLINNHIEFTKNIDITSYKNGVRKTLNPEGRATAPVVWENYANGCSIRLLNPQTFIPSIFAMNCSLQELFHCMVGSNVYLTPPNSQGFAPHYDDIEAFVLQIEGRKRWKLYNPRNKNEYLPRYSSENFKQSEIGKPILEKVLSPGDILYFPRGTIHQACTEPGFHSLHITLSVYQKQSFADLFEKMFPMILQRAINEDVEFRRGLPLNVWYNAGIVHSDVVSPERKEFVRRCRNLIAKSLEEIPIDQAVDQLAKKFQHEALPPSLTDAEKCRTVFGSKNLVDSKGHVINDYNIDSNTKVRLLRANIMRLVEEDGVMRLYYYVDNSKEYCEYEPNYIEIENECVGSVEVLIRSYPEYIAVNELPLEDDEEKKIGIVTALWERGLLMFEKPFKR